MNDDAKDKEIMRLKQAIKKAVGALYSAERALGDKPTARSKVIDTIKAIEDLGKE